MNIDPDGKLALSFIILSIVGGAIMGAISSGVKAADDGLSLQNVFLASLGGAIMGAAVAGAFALGGAAATGLTVFGKAANISRIALFAVAAYGTSVAGVVDYAIESKAYGIEPTAEGYFVSAFNGFVEGVTSFIFGGTAGIKGYFKNADKSIFKYSKFYEKIMRTVKYILPSLCIRSVLKWFLQQNWGVKL